MGETVKSLRKVTLKENNQKNEGNKEKERKDITE